MKHGAGGPKHSEEVSANQLLLRALAGQSPGAITPASSESLRTQRRHQPRNWPILSWLTAAVMEAGERRRRRKRRRKRERENREQHLRKSEKLLQDLDTAEMVGHFRSVRFWAGEHSPLGKERSNLRAKPSPSRAERYLAEPSSAAASAFWAQKPRTSPLRRPK
ncbi:uncharacterized protein LOC134148452 isoform X15 [Rhea pennata]|uniref:uncharacterized protein LOC134148452 isoform X15 n=1 Tax=Rhea pennata TaxID=8795 RepID=UPI002E265A29